jgi:hypothetical protein
LPVVGVLASILAARCEGCYACDSSYSDVISIDCKSGRVAVGQDLVLRAETTVASGEFESGCRFQWLVDTPYAKIVSSSTSEGMWTVDAGGSGCRTEATLRGVSPGTVRVRASPDGWSGPLEGENACTIQVVAAGSDAAPPVLDGATADLLLPDGPVDLGSMHEGPACTQIQPPQKAAAYPNLGQVCDPEHVLKKDGAVTGLGRLPSDKGIYIGSQYPTACVEVDFGATINAQYARVVIRAVNATCGAKCVGDVCDTGQTVGLFSSTDGSAYQYAGFSEITSKLDLHGIELTAPLQYLLVCRGGWGYGRDHLEVDYVDLCY